MFDRIIARAALDTIDRDDNTRVISTRRRARRLQVSQRYILLYYTRVIWRKLQAEAAAEVGGQFARMENRCVTTAYLELARETGIFSRAPTVRQFASDENFG